MLVLDQESNSPTSSNGLSDYLCGMTAKIGLEDVRFYAPHGFYEEEHRMGNEFSIDVEVEAAITGAAEHDDLGGTVNYATIYYLLQAEMKKPTQLLEALAYRMGNRILNQFDSVSSVKLRLRKLNPPLGGKVGAAVVEILVNTGSGGGGANDQFTYEDDPGAFGDEGGAFGGGGYGGGGGGMGGLIKKPKPMAPAPPPTEKEAFAEEEDYFDDELDDDDFLSDEALAAMAAEDEDMEMPEDMDLGDDFDFDDMDFDDMDFGDLDIPDFDPDKR